MNHLKITIGLLTFLLFATCSLQAQEVIIGESGFDAFNTMRAEGGIALKIIETANVNMVKSVGFAYYDPTKGNDTIRYNVDKNGITYLPMPKFEKGSWFSQDSKLLIFDHNNKQIGHIGFSYSFEWEKMHSRQAILFFHNDGDIFGGDPNNPNRYFPYHRNSPNNLTNWAGNKRRYNYYQDGEYPVSMLIPPHYNSDCYIIEGYRLPYRFDIKPVLFVHGLTGTFSYSKHAMPELTDSLGDQVSYWYHTERLLNTKKVNGERKYHAWQFYYPNEDDLVHCGLMLQQAVSYLTDKYEQPLNFYAHSMGGLVTMEYLSQLSDQSMQKIGKILLSQSPIHGSLGANKNYGTPLGWFMSYLNQDGFAPAYRDMSIGSRFIYNLHAREWSNALIANTFVIIGLTPKNYKLPKALHVEASHHEDGIVSYTSASLLRRGIGLLGFYGNHDEGRFGKAIYDQSFLPNLIDAYLSDESTNHINFKNYCNNNEQVEVYIDGNKNVHKPAGQNINNLSINKSDVDFQKAMISIRTNELTLGHYYFINHETKNEFVINAIGTSIYGAGRITRNKHSKQSDNYRSFYYHNWIDIGQECTGFTFLETRPVLYYKHRWFGPNLSYFLGYVTKNAMEYQFVEFPPFLHKSVDPLSIQQTPQKVFQDPNNTECEYVAFDIDQLTSYFEFILYSDDANIENAYYSFYLVNPHEELFDSTSVEVTYTTDEYTNIKRMSLVNPVPGQWRLYPLSNSANELEFVSIGELESQIKVHSLISTNGYDSQQPIELSALIAVPDNELLQLDNLSATIFTYDQTEQIDTLYLENVHVADSGYVVSLPFDKDEAGEYLYLIEVRGKYDEFWFERAVYGSFEILDLATVLNVPDQYLNRTSQQKTLRLVHYIYSEIHEVDSLSFEVNLISSNFPENDLLFELLPEGSLQIVVNHDAPNAEAFFDVNALYQDTLVATDSFRVWYSKPSVPANLSAVSISANSLALQWTPGGLESHWDILYGESGFNPQSEGTMIEGADNIPHFIYNLDQGTNYDFYVRAVVDEDNYSDWSWPATLTTNHVISATSGSNGSISPSGEVEVMHMHHQLFNISPEYYSHIYDVLVNGESIGPVTSYRFSHVSSSYEIHADFAMNIYDIYAHTSNVDHGSTMGTGTYEHFEDVTLTATPQTGYHFIEWRENNQVVMDGDQPAGSIYSFMAEANRSLVAHFAVNTYEITAQPNNEDFGSVAGTGEYDHFEYATLTAIPETGYHFVYWTENDDVITENDDQPAGSIYTFIVDKERDLVAHFAINVYNIAAVPNNSDFGSVTGSDEYEHFEEVVLVATPADGYNFIYWTDNGQIITIEGEFAGETYSFIAEKARIITANFLPDHIDVEFVVNINNQIISTGESECFNAFHTIAIGGDAPFVAEPGAEVSLVSGYRILMLPGAHIQQGSYLEAYIVPIWPFCEEQDIHFLAAYNTGKADHKSEDESLLTDNLQDSDKFFKVYPNPTKDKFTLELHNYEHGTDITVEVYGMRGELIKHRKLEANQQHVLSLEGQQPGIYLIRVMQGEQVGVERLIKR